LIVVHGYLLKLETRELIRDNANGWLKELFENVVATLSPDLERITLIVAESFRQAKTNLGSAGERAGSEAGITRVLEETHSKPGDETLLKPWKGAVDFSSNSVYVIVKPTRIRELHCIYEMVTWGMAHEISEGVVSIHNQPDWDWLGQREQVVLHSYHPNPDRVLYAVKMIVREILANNYAAEHGFQREMLCTTSVENARYFASGISPEDISPESGYSRVHAYMTLLSQDRSVSLEAAGHKELADICLKIWDAGISALGETYESLLGGYKGFRSKCLASPLTAESLLTLFNTTCITSTPVS